MPFDDYKVVISTVVALDTCIYMWVGILLGEVLGILGVFFTTVSHDVI